MQKLIDDVENLSKNKTGMTLNIAMNYGSRTELINAVKKIASDVKNDCVKIEEIDENTISNRLYTVGQPDPDLIIRPSGEYRLSNFLLWQSAYAELVFMNVLWPDFTEDNLEQAIDEYLSRNRRFGGV